MKNLILSVLMISIILISPVHGTNEISISRTTENVLSIPDYAEPPIKHDIDFYKLLFKMVIATMITVALIILFAWFMKKKTGIHTSSKIKVLDQFQFAPGKHILLIEIYGKILVIGTSGDRITKLAEFTDKDEKKEIMLQITQGLVRGKSFGDYLDQWTGDVNQEKNEN